MEIVEQIKEKAIIVQSNEIVEANYRLDPAEQKLILALISKIDTRKDDFEIIKISAKSLSDACGFNAKSGYRQLQQIIKKLLDRSIILRKRDGSGWYGSHWLQCCEYVSAKQGDNDCSYVEVEFDRRLCPHFLNLKNKFLEIGLNHLILFTHNYSIRFYMIFRNLVNSLPKCTKKYTFSEIIKMFKLPKSYQQTRNIKYAVIKKSVDEINKKSDIIVEYKYYSEGGRAHVGVIFTFWKKDNTDKKEIIPPADMTEQEPLQLTSSSVITEDDIDNLDEIDLAALFASIEDMDEYELDAYLDAYLETTETAEQTDHSAGLALLQSIGINPPTSSDKKKKEEPAPTPVPTVAKAEEKVEPPKPAYSGREKWTDEQQADYDTLVKYDIWKPAAEKYVNELTHEQIKRNIDGVLKAKPKGNIRDLGAVLAKAIENDTYQGLAEDQAKAREREQARKKVEYNAMIQNEQKKIEDRQKIAIENEELRKIRATKSKEELLLVFEEVLQAYKCNDNELNDEMCQKLSANGIPQRDFTSYLHEITRKYIKYIQ